MDPTILSFITIQLSLYFAAFSLGSIVGEYLGPPAAEFVSRCIF